MQHTVGERFCKEKRAKQASHVNEINKQSSNEATMRQVRRLVVRTQAWKFFFTNAEFLELQFNHSQPLGSISNDRASPLA
jgi:hypothetical protein